VIFVSTGTNEAPFDRLTEAARTLGDGEELLVQYGSSRVTSGPGEWRDYLSFDEMEAAMRRARVVVVHAGVGSILLALRCGRVPVVMARRRGEEAVDDHQAILARRLATTGQVTVVDDAAALRDAVARPSHDRRPGGSGGVTSETLTAELRELIGRHVGVS
jgi:UDP-N-acetylglucosamine transferase subunit ALG13